MTLVINSATALMVTAYITGANAAFGSQGSDALRILFEAVRQVYSARPPELLHATLTIAVPIDQTSAAATLQQCSDVQMLSSHDEAGYYLASHSTQDCLLVVNANLTFTGAVRSAGVSPASMAAASVVYHFAGSEERVLAGASDAVVPRLSTLHKSNFADPTFTSLDEALDSYGVHAAESHCEVLKQVWEGGVDGARLVFVNKPESIMRDSLYQALSTGLRRADVTREHVTDDTKPVDIKVAWRGSPAEALIEVKWLGRALAKVGPPQTYTDYSAGRAQEGADQLADYLDRKSANSANPSILGYLVVFDGRRRKIAGPNDKLAKADALHFQALDLIYDPNHGQTRLDFKPPRRWFLRPRQTHFLEAS